MGELWLLIKKRKEKKPKSIKKRTQTKINTTCNEQKGKGNKSEMKIRHMHNNYCCRISAANFKWKFWHYWWLLQVQLQYATCTVLLLSLDMVHECYSSHYTTYNYTIYHTLCTCIWCSISYNMCLNVNYTLVTTWM